LYILSLISVPVAAARTLPAQGDLTLTVICFVRRCPVDEFIVTD
jgi:hypothetical protein